MYLSDWARKTVMGSADVLQIIGPPVTEAEVFEALARMSSEIDRAADGVEAAKLDALAASMRRLRNTLLEMVHRHQREIEEMSAALSRAFESADALRAKLASTE